MNAENKLNTEAIDSASDRHLRVDLETQTLALYDNAKCISRYPVATARNGPGERFGSECTPTGWHRIRARIGAGLPLNTIFVGRRATGEIYSTELAEKFPDRDWILTRILWLSGLEPGRNRFGDVDTAWRYIYIHGSPDHCIAGTANSHGCVRMRNTDILELFEQVRNDLPVLIR